MKVRQQRSGTYGTKERIRVKLRLILPSTLESSLDRCMRMQLRAAKLICTGACKVPHSNKQSNCCMQRSAAALNKLTPQHHTQVGGAW